MRNTAFRNYIEGSGCRFAERCPQVREECKVNDQEIRIVGDRQVRCGYAE